MSDRRITCTQRVGVPARLSYVTKEAYGTLTRRILGHVGDGPDQHEIELAEVTLDPMPHPLNKHLLLDPLVVTVPNEELSWLRYDASVTVQYDGVESPEDAALALINWLRFSKDAVYVHARGEDGVIYQVLVDVDDDGNLTAVRES